MKNNRVSSQMAAFWGETQEKERNTVVSLELIQGGKDGGDGLSWLLGLEEKTAFLVEEVHAGANIPRYVLLQFFLAKKFDKAVLLYDSRQQEIFVNPNRFCSQFRLYEILYDPKTMPPIEYEEEKENEGDRIQPTNVGETDQLDSTP